MKSLAYRLFLPWMTALRERTHAAALRRTPFALADKDTIRVLAPRAPGPARGGRLKCDLVAGRWPVAHGAHTLFNVLYLVSSALPPAFKEYIRIAKRIGAAVVWNQNGVAYPAWAGFRAAAINDMLRWGLHRADHVVYQSEYCKRMSVQWLGRPNMQRDDMLYNPVDLKAFTARADRPLLGRQKIAMLAMGSHQSSYRVPLLCATLRHLRAMGHLDASLAIWGPMSNDDRERAAKGGVFAGGAYDHGNAPAIYHAYDVLLHAQHNDASPSVVGEALASGLPVVGLKSGAMPALVGDCGALAGVDERWAPTVDAEGSWHGLEDVAERLAAAVVRARFEIPIERCRARAEKLFDQDAWLRRHGSLFAALVYGAQKHVPPTWTEER